MSYATYEDVQNRIGRELSDSEQSLCTTLLDDAGTIIDSYNMDASDENKKIVSCRMVIRIISAGPSDVPIGATQGSMGGLGYTQSWTISNGASGEMYLSRLDKKLLGVNNKIGFHSPLEDLEG